MAKVIDLTNSDGDLVILGNSLVLPNSTVNSQPHPLNGALRFNPEVGAAQLFYAGTWTTLGEGSSGGSGDAGGPPWTVAQITGLQNILNGKAATVHSHAITDVSGLSTTLAGKSDVGHTHVVADVAALQSDLDAKANLVHTHSITIQDTISASWPGSPPANYKMIYTAAFALHFPINLSGSIIKVGTAPSATFTVSLFKNVSTNVGSIIFYPNGQITCTMAAALNLSPGDTLTFQCPARDVVLSDISFSLIGSRDAQTTS